MVSAGFTPRFAQTAAPSTTCSPGYPKTRWYPSMTPLSGPAPMTAPPRMCAVTGMLNTSVHEPAGAPPISSASSRTARFPAGIQRGFGAPWPCVVLSRSRPVPHRFDMRIGIRVERAGDGHAVGEVGVAAQRPGAEDRLRVRPGERAEPVGQVRQHTARLHGVQQPLGTQRPGREYHVIRGVRALLRAYRPPRPDPGHRVPCEHLHAELLGDGPARLHKRLLPV